MGETQKKKKKQTKQNKSKNNILKPHPTNLPAPQGLAAFKPRSKSQRIINHPQQKPLQGVGGGKSKRNRTKTKEQRQKTKAHARA